MADDQRDKLKSILAKIEDMIAETIKSRLELKEIEAEYEHSYQKGDISMFKYEIEMERIRRVHKKAQYCMKILERQKKIVVYGLRKTE